jgi:hypothetical protein
MHYYTTVSCNCKGFFTDFMHDFARKKKKVSKSGGALTFLWVCAIISKEIKREGSTT